jgi:hypothetical protein
MALHVQFVLAKEAKMLRIKILWNGLLTFLSIYLLWGKRKYCRPDKQSINRILMPKLLRKARSSGTQAKQQGNYSFLFHIIRYQIYAFYVWHGF